MKTLMVWTIAGLIALASTAAVAATIEVSSNADAAADDGLCTLREAINSANTRYGFGFDER